MILSRTFVRRVALNLRILHFHELFAEACVAGIRIVFEEEEAFLTADFDCITFTHAAGFQGRGTADVLDSVDGIPEVVNHIVQSVSYSHCHIFLHDLPDHMLLAGFSG